MWRARASWRRPGPVPTRPARWSGRCARKDFARAGPLGYSAAGTVVGVGSRVRGLAPGDRVAIAGAGAANHSEIDVVPALQCAPVPEGVDARSAAFATVGAIAMQGFRRADVQVGSTVAVIGLGLIGQLAARIAASAGCEVVGVDLREDLLELARGAGVEARERQGIEDDPSLEGIADTVLICAAAPSSDPVELAAHLARDRASVVVVGDVGMELPRKPFYEKELDLRLSRSYGPGRYDPAYEVHGADYPIGYVRWTQQRNMESFLGLVSRGRIEPWELISHRFEFEEAEAAFDLLGSDEPVIAIVLEYGRDDVDGDDSGPLAALDSRPARRRPARRAEGAPRFGLIGAGNFATSTILPGLQAAGFEPGSVASAGGLSAESARRRFGFESVAQGPEEVIEDEGLDLVVIATRHDLHAELTAAALDAGRPVYVEKPLALDAEELDLVLLAQRRSGAPLVVGFNRRFAPGAALCRELDGPRLMTFRVNAGPLPEGHWLGDPLRGGGRLLGEGCHFVDFLCDQAGCDPLAVSAAGYPTDPGAPRQSLDNFSLRIEFTDGSVGTVNYSSAGAQGPGKERFEVSSPGAHGVIDDFKRTSVWRGSRRSRQGGLGQDKGFVGQYRMLHDVVSGNAEPPSVESYAISTMATIAGLRSLETGSPQPGVTAVGS